MYERVREDAMAKDKKCIKCNGFLYKLGRRRWRCLNCGMNDEVVCIFMDRLHEEWKWKNRHEVPYEGLIKGYV